MVSLIWSYKYTYIKHCEKIVKLTNWSPIGMRHVVVPAIVPLFFSLTYKFLCKENGYKLSHEKCVYLNGMLKLQNRLLKIARVRISFIRYAWQTNAKQIKCHMIFKLSGILLMTNEVVFHKTFMEMSSCIRPTNS